MAKVGHAQILNLMIECLSIEMLQTVDSPVEVQLKATGVLCTGVKLWLNCYESQ